MIEIVGANSLLKRLQKLPDKVSQGVKDVIAAEALMVQNEVRRSIQRGPKSGKTYRRGAIRSGRGKNRVTTGYKFHRASAPGQAPATDTGRLASHINHFLRENGFVADVGIKNLAQVKYARRLEFGGMDKKGRYIAPRPYLRPALRKRAKFIIKRLTKSVQKALSHGS